MLVMSVMQSRFIRFAFRRLLCALGPLLCVMPFAGMADDKGAAAFAQLQEMYQAGTVKIRTRSVEAAEANKLKYLDGLASVEAAIRNAGDLNGILLVQQEQKRVAKESKPLTKPAPGTPANLLSLQKQYHENYFAAERQSRAASAKLMGQYTQKLEAFQKQLVRANDIETAVLVKSELDAVAAQQAALKTGSLPAVAAASTRAEPSVPVSSSALLLPPRLREELVLYYPFNTHENQQTPDASPMKNHGKIQGAEWVSEGRLGGAFRIASNEQGVTSSRLLDFKRDKAWSLSMWVKVEKPHEGSRRADGRLAAWLTEGGRCFVSTWAGNWGMFFGYRDWSTPNKVPVDTWQHHGINYFRDHVEWFINGESIGDFKAKRREPALEMTLGFGTTQCVIDEVMVYDRALDSAEFQQLIELTNRAAK